MITDLIERCKIIKLLEEDEEKKPLRTKTRQGILGHDSKNTIH